MTKLTNQELFVNFIVFNVAQGLSNSPTSRVELG